MNQPTHQVTLAVIMEYNGMDLYEIADASITDEEYNEIMEQE